MDEQELNLIRDLSTKVDSFITVMTQKVTEIDGRVCVLEKCITDEKTNKKFLLTTLPTYLLLGLNILTFYFLVTKVWF